MGKELPVPDLSGIVLCGGLSRRMGADKALLPWEGKLLLAHVVERVGSVAQEVVVVARPGQERPETAARLVTDRVPGAGPLAGLEAGLGAITAEFGVVVACDMPWLDPALLRAMAAEAPGHDLVIPFFEGKYHPLHAVYARGILPLVKELLSAGERRLHVLADRVKTRVLDDACIRARNPSGRSLVSLDTPAAYRSALFPTGFPLTHTQEVGMLKAARVGLLALALVMAAGSGVSLAARGGQGTPMFKGGWHPKVGSGAVYRIEQAGQPAMDWEVAVVGQEAGAYWLEMRMTTPEEMILKTLMAPGEVKRTIVKSGREPAMELSGMSAGQGVPETDIDKDAKLIGKESVTVPAGTFSCDHYQTQGHGSPADVWVTSQVSPYGLVKMTGSGTTMVLSRLVSGAKTRITETPQKFEIPDMPGMEEIMKQMKEQQQ